jgi:hypothetical protein
VRETDIGRSHAFLGSTVPVHRATNLDLTLPSPERTQAIRFIDRAISLFGDDEARDLAEMMFAETPTRKRVSGNSARRKRLDGSWETS